jgi:hypothetical protein
VNELIHPAHAATPTMNPLKKIKHVVAETCKRMRRSSVGLQGKMELLCWAIANPYFEVQETLQNMYSMLPHK